MNILLRPISEISPDDLPAPSAEEAELFARPFVLEQPATLENPFILCSPHSGRLYPGSFVRSSNLDSVTLRRSEDSFVEEILADAASLGTPLLHARFPRAYLDANREPYELDPAMFTDPLPAHVNTRSMRVAGGIGTIARIVADSAEIYKSPLPYMEAERRIRFLYMPFHDALRELLEERHQAFGTAILIDCHSMPSVGGPGDNDSGADRPDIVLGDRYGNACSAVLTNEADRILTGLGFTVARNNPYAGGFNTEHYGQPHFGLHALQIELNRALYMDEIRIKRGPGLKQVREKMRLFIQEMTAMDWVELLRP